MDYDNLDHHLQKKIQNCNLKLEEAQKRCEENYNTKCVMVNPVSVTQPCPSTHIMVDNFECIPKCPTELGENGKTCLKNKAYYVEIYSN